MLHVFLQLTNCFQSLKALYKFSVNFVVVVADVNHLSGLHLSDTVI